MLVWGFLFLFVCVCVYSLFFPDLAIMPCFVGWLITCFLILWFLLFSDFLEYPLLVTDRLYSLRNLLREFGMGSAQLLTKLSICRLESIVQIHCLMWSQFQ